MSATGAGLIETKPTTLNGRRFRRFLAQEVPANSVFTVAASIAPGGISPRTAFMVIGIGAVMLLALARSFGSQASRARHRNRDDDPDALDRALRSLDAAYANLAEPTPDQRADHYEARAHLALRRSAALARRDARP